MAAKLLADIDYKPLMAAVVRQAIADLTKSEINLQLDAALFFAQGDFPVYADVLRLPSDGLELLRTGKARELIAAEKEQALREYNRDAKRAWRRKHG